MQNVVRTAVTSLFAKRLAAAAAHSSSPTTSSSILLSLNNNNKFLHTTNTNMASLLAGQTLVVDRQGTKKSADEFLKDKVVALYFSAMWCPPCRAFTPKLKKFYEDLKAKGKNIEVVFVSRDRAPEDLLEYYKEHMAEWTYLELGNEKIYELLEQYEVKTIPTLRVIKPDGKVVVTEARNEVAEKGDKPEELFEEWMGYYNI